MRGVTGVGSIQVFFYSTCLNCKSPKLIKLTIFTDMSADNEQVPLCFTASGGKAFGPRGPKSFFYMLSKTDRVNGLRSALSVKYGQDNLHIVDSLDLPTEDPDVSWQCPL